VAADSDLGDMRPTPASSSASVQSFFVRESHAIMVEEMLLSPQYFSPSFAELRAERREVAVQQQACRHLVLVVDMQRL
jgi:hypothetical protein